MLGSQKKKLKLVLHTEKAVLFNQVLKMNKNRSLKLKSENNSHIEQR